MHKQSDLEKMSIFSSDNTEDTIEPVTLAEPAKDLLKEPDVVTADPFSTEADAKSQQIYNLLAEHYDDDLLRYISPSMSPKMLVCYEEVYRLHPSNAKRLAELGFDEEQSYQMLESFRHQIDLAEEIAAGVTDEDLNALLAAIDSGCSLKEIFTEDGAFINYSYLKEKFGKK